MTTPQNQAAVELLLAMTAEELENIVVSQLNPTRREPEVYAALMSPQVITRTKDTLDILRTRSQDTMQAKRAELTDFQSDCAQQGPAGKQIWLRGKGQYSAELRKSGHFLKLVESMQIETKRALRDARIAARQAADEAKAERRAAADSGPRRRGTLWILVGALINHEAEQQHDCTEHDEKLWDLLDTMTCMWDEQEMSLREAYERGWG